MEPNMAQAAYERIVQDLPNVSFTTEVDQDASCISETGTYIFLNICVPGKAIGLREQLPETFFGQLNVPNQFLIRVPIGNLGNFTQESYAQLIFESLNTHFAHFVRFTLELIEDERRLTNQLRALRTPKDIRSFRLPVVITHSGGFRSSLDGSVTCEAVFTDEQLQGIIAAAEANATNYNRGYNFL